MKPDPALLHSNSILDETGDLAEVIDAENESRRAVGALLIAAALEEDAVNLAPLRVESDEKLIEIGFTVLHEGAKDLVRAHAVYFRNWLPRDAVIKSVRADNRTQKL